LDFEQHHIGLDSTYTAHDPNSPLLLNARKRTTSNTDTDSIARNRQD